MRRLRPLVLPAILAVALATANPVPLLAQTCDFMIASATWAPHPDPDSIYIILRPDVVGPVSSDPLNPTLYDMEIRINFNGAPLEPPHVVGLSWWQKNDNCVEPCTPVVCLLKNWNYKNVFWTDQSVCIRSPVTNLCGCPPIGTPVPQAKPVPKPPAPGLIEIEIIPLGLQSCTPINPGNDRKQFSYPGGAENVPGATPAALALLTAGLGLVALLISKRREGVREA